MRKIFMSIAAMGFAVFMGSCGTGSKTANVNLAGEWNIVDVNGEAVSADAKPFLGLDMAGKRLYGNAGCNRVMGVVEYDSVQPGKIRFTSVGATRMMCPEMETEGKVLAALDKIAGYSGTEDKLVLVDAEGNNVMTMAKRKAAEVSLNSLEGEWTLVSVGGETLGEMENTPFLAFNVAEKRVHGNAGCNTVNGNLVQEEGNPVSLKFDQMISTMMSCPNMDAEGKIMEALGKVRSFAIDADGNLSLLDENGQEVAGLEKK